MLEQLGLVAKAFKIWLGRYGDLSQSQLHVPLMSKMKKNFVHANGDL